MVSKEMQGVAAERQAWVETYCWLMQAMEEYEWPKLMPMTAPAASVMIVYLWYGGVETEGGSDGVGMDGAFSLGGGGGASLAAAALASTSTPSRHPTPKFRRETFFSLGGFFLLLLARQHCRSGERRWLAATPWVQAFGHCRSRSSSVYGSRRKVSKCLISESGLYRTSGRFGESDTLRAYAPPRASPGSIRGVGLAFCCPRHC